MWRHGNDIVSLALKGGICHFAKLQMPPFNDVLLYDGENGIDLNNNVPINPHPSVCVAHNVPANLLARATNLNGARHKLARLKQRRWFNDGLHQANDKYNKWSDYLIGFDSCINESDMFA